MLYPHTLTFTSRERYAAVRIMFRLNELGKIRLTTRGRVISANTWYIDYWV